jgi:hypothetical protein
MSNRKILCLLPICCYPANMSSNNGAERIQQYVNGLSKFFEYIDILKKHNVDTYITDNSIKKDSKLPLEILTIIPEHVIISTSLNNHFGAINKGAGLIEQWLYCKDIIVKYDWLIHFEPRQLLLNFNFINNFLENPRNLFALGNDKKHFNTGLFCIETGSLLHYSTSVDLNIMSTRYISIENDLYNYIIKHKIKFDILDKMELIWFDIAAKKSFIV